MLDKTQVKTIRIQFNVTEQDKEFIYAAAKESKMTVSEFIRQAIKYYVENNGGNN